MELVMKAKSNKGKCSEDRSKSVIPAMKKINAKPSRRRVMNGYRKRRNK